MKKPLIVAVTCLALLLAVAFLFKPYWYDRWDAANRSMPATDTPVSTTTVAKEDAEKLVHREEAKSTEFRSLTLAQPEKAAWWHGATVYQIWPRSFKDSDGNGNGDLLGIVSKLDYLKRLGVQALWLNPIFESDSYHGYDTTDFYQIESDYGTLADFDTLIAEAHARDIKVILDLVVNHVSMDHPWFKHSANNVPEYRDYFVWQKDMPKDYGPAWSDEVRPNAVWHYVGKENTWRSDSTRKDFYYGVFGFAQPDLNLANPTVRQEIYDVARFWLDRGVDGFRLDAVRYPVEEGPGAKQRDTDSTLAFWREFRSTLKATHPDALLVGEAFAEASTAGRYYLEGNGLDACFDFGFHFVSTDALKTPAGDLSVAEKERHFASARDALWENLLQKHDSKAPVYYFANTLSNHDLERSSHTLGNNPLRAKLVATLLLTLPGSPYIYYGEEIGLPQYKSGDDLYRRAPMQWEAKANAGFTTGNQVWVEQEKWRSWMREPHKWWSPFWEAQQSHPLNNVAAHDASEGSLLNYYRKLIQIRTTHRPLHLPKQLRLFNTPSSLWIAEHSSENSVLWVVMNMDADNKVTAEIPGDLSGQFLDVLTQKTWDLFGEITLAPGEVRIYSPLVE